MSILDASYGDKSAREVMPLHLISPVPSEMEQILKSHRTPKIKLLTNLPADPLAPALVSEIL